MQTNTTVPQKKQSLTIFMRDLPETSKEESLTLFFSNFGPIVKTKLKMIKGNQVCGGYGFMECQEMATFDTILAKGTFAFEGAEIMCVKNIKGVTLNLYKQELEQRKVYVLGVPQSLKDTQLMEIFAQAGEVSRAYTVKQGRKKQSKHFAFVIFKTAAAAKKALEIKKFRFKKFKLTCKKFESNSKRKTGKVAKTQQKAQNPSAVSSKDEKESKATFPKNSRESPKIGSLQKFKIESEDPKSFKFDLDFLKNFTNPSQSQAVRNPQMRGNFVPKLNTTNVRAQYAREMNSEKPGSDYTKSCIKYARPVTPEQPVVLGNQLEAIPIIPTQPQQAQNLARKPLDEGFVQRELKVSEVLKNRASWAIRFQNHNVGNLKFSHGKRRNCAGYSGYTWF